MPAFSKLLSPALSLIVIINVVGLWLISIHQFKQIQSLTNNQTVFFDAASGMDSSVPTASDSAPNSVVTKPNVSIALLEAIQSQIKDLQKINQGLELQVKTLTDEISVLKAASPAQGSGSSSNVAKEYVIYLGSGNSTSTDWQQLTGAEYLFNPALYPPIKSISFEANLSIVGGEARARLVNKTNGAIITSSEVMNNSSSSTWKTSGVIPIPTTEQNYVVQLRSSSGERANLEGARLRVVVE